MIRITLGYIYKIGEQLHPLTQLSGDKKLLDIFSEVLAAKTLLTELFTGNTFGLRISYSSALRFNSLLEMYINPPSGDIDRDIFAWEIAKLAQAALAFETSLIEELGALPSYLVTPKGAYDVNILTLTPNQAFHPELIWFVPESAYDIEQAAKCMAFEVPTAAAFHMHRLTESVVHNYWDAVSDGKARLKKNSVGDYIKEMEEQKIGKDEVLSTLKQINKLHRNPVIHPEQNYDTQEAIELFGITVSATSAMLNTIRAFRIEQAKAGTSSPLVLVEKVS